VIGSIREILKIQTVEDLGAAFLQFDSELDRFLEPLYKALDMNIMSSEVQDIVAHMAYVEKFRGRVTRYFSLAAAFTDYAKSSIFIQPTAKGVTEFVRDAHRRSLAGPFQALSERLEHLIDSIDSRVNLCKKITGMEVVGERQKPRVA
jgi:hypothetical protein